MIPGLGTLLLAAQLAAGSALSPPAAGGRPVEIVVFSDFQCPFCASFSRPLRELQRTGVDGVAVQVTFKHFPLPFHSNAPLAHRAAIAAGAQGRFWEMHDLLFSDLRRVGRPDLVAHARTLGLDLEQFERDIDSDRVKQAIELDRLDGHQLRVGGTPTFFVNGREHTGHTPLAELRGMVIAEHQRARLSSDVTDGSMSLGRAGAPVAVELFVDLRSPLSRRAVDAVNELVKARPADVRLQFRHFPLSYHPQAGLAHEAAVIAARSGRFWEYAGYLLDHQSSLGEQDLIALAARVGLDPEDFTRTLHEHRYAARVDADRHAGLMRGIRGSPAILVNGRRIDGVPTLQELTAAVDEAPGLRSQPDQSRKQ
jgi:protein-disulfide isomerase